jgi:Gamma-glutamyl cyclotransferase, AIG2-like
MALYFAFGRLLHPEAMRALCPKALVIGMARLPRHRLVVFPNGAATVLRDPRREVMGLVYDVPFGEMALIDRQAGRAQKINQPVLLPGGAKRALLHLPEGRSGEADLATRSKLAEAAEAAGLPAGYVHEIRHGEPAPRKPGTPIFQAPSGGLNRR